MAQDITAKQKEVDRNFEVFSARLNQFMPLHANKFALMRDGEVVEFYSNWHDAWKTGNKFYDDALFSIQKVTKTPVDLGYFSHAVHIR